MVFADPLMKGNIWGSNFQLKHEIASDLQKQMIMIHEVTALISDSA